MKYVELIGYAVREYDVKYSVVLDENDPIFKKFLQDNEIEFDDLTSLTHHEYRSIWDTLMDIPATNLKIEEDFAQGDERFVDFETFVSDDTDD